MCTKVLRQAGVTLVELIMAMVIIGIATVGIVRLISSSSSASADPVLRKQALLIAEGLMEEVQTAYFTFCDLSDDSVYSAAQGACDTTNEVRGPEAGNARPFDNVNDYYNGSSPGGTYSFTNASGAVTDANGTVLTSDKYSATVNIDPVLPAAAPLGPPGAATEIQSSLADMRAILITIQVRYGSRTDDVVRLDSYRTRYAPNIVK